ncbi:ABC transporter ATP-binding protein [Ramlibacter alkalitolerans]|uniref:ABC transporter ATP-binding protein n=1 Tax=Ramlibacter alkalitolerans TaxID=2039631 RepID=A0ABS1JHE4_9BURK|nr:ABC transporter ATP-binding protein [Ramlibacter alkalitolerans]MBL0423633.1 ABC transporter ATP-binding protein [Ramlibacter alkalitolerans]
MLEVKSLASRYGRIPALAGVTLHVRAGEMVAIVGANGAGKTTLLRTLSGVQPPCGGSIVFEGQDLLKLHARQRVQAGIIQVPEGRQVFAQMTVEDNLRLGAFARGSAHHLDPVLDLFPVLRDKFRELAGNLSGGQQQMLAIGRALMARPRLLLLDEPGMGLAPRLVAEIFSRIAALGKVGTTILLVDQNARAALGVASRGYVMETGRIVLEGSARDLLHDRQVQRAYLGSA